MEGNGCPRSGVVYNIKVKTRAKYHYVLKMVKNKRDSIVADKIAQSLLQHKSSNFWAEIKKIKGKTSSLPKTIDGVVGSKNICELFGDKYKTLYNSVSYSKCDMALLKADVDQRISNSCSSGNCYNNHKISVSEIISGVKHMKHGKCDGNVGHCSDHIINGSHKLFVCLSLLFQIMLTHGYVPQDMQLGTIIPIPKDRNKSLSVSNNYRGITLSSIIGKLFDIVLLDKNCSVFDTSELQFGFKAKHSTHSCTFVLNEVVDYYTKNESDMYIMLLDCSKAFDRVNYTKLFALLIDRGLCPLTARFLIQLYTNQVLRIKWSDYLSENINVSNGVKQGGILSPILFIVYMDVLLLRLKQSKVGCYIGNNFCGALGYADDVALLCPSLSSLKIMLGIADDFGREYDVKFNSEKYQLLIYSDNPIGGIDHRGNFIKTQCFAKYLGNIVGPDESKKSVNYITDKFSIACNTVVNTFGHLTSDVKYKLFKAYCMPLYGCIHWDISSQKIELFYKQWRKGIRKLFGISTRTHCDLLPLICRDKTIEIQLCLRVLNFICRNTLSQNKLVRLCAQHTLHDSGSNASASLAFIAEKCGKNKEFVIREANKVKRLLNESSVHVVNRDSLQSASFILDLIHLRESGSHNTIMSKEEINDILEYLCTK